MTRWGVVLLAAYVILGLVGMDEAKASRLAVWTTIVLLVGVGFKFGAL